jgi:hypothetical protein
MLYTKLCDLPGLALKSDEVVDVLEHFELPVIYDFDRSNEGTDDVYWASAKQAGFELRFNARQVLDVIFLYPESQGEFQKVNQEFAGVPFYQSYGEAKEAFLAQHRSIKEGANQSWIKGEFSGFSAHYEFSLLGALVLVTLTDSQGRPIE